MTKEELEKEAEQSLDKRLGTYGYIMKQNCYRNYVDGYTDSAEPREKQIQIDAEQIRALQKQNGELTDKVNDLEEKLANADYQLEGRDNEIRELKAQLEREKNLNQCMSDNNEQLRKLNKKLQNCWNCKKSFNKSCSFGKKCEADKKKCKDWESTFGVSD